MADFPEIAKPIDIDISDVNKMELGENLHLSDTGTSEPLHEPVESTSDNIISYQNDEEIKYTNLSCKKSLIEQIIAISNGETLDDSTLETEEENESKIEPPKDESNINVLPRESETSLDIVQASDCLAEQNNQLTGEFTSEPLIDECTSSVNPNGKQDVKLKDGDSLLNQETSNDSRSSPYSNISDVSEENSMETQDTVTKLKPETEMQVINISVKTPNQESGLINIASTNLFNNIKEIQNESDAVNEATTLLPYSSLQGNTNLNVILIPEFVGPQAGLSDSQPFLSASALSPVASFEDEKFVAIATEMASAHAPPEMPLQLAPTILINATQPIVSIPNLSALKHSPKKDKMSAAVTENLRAGEKETCANSAIEMKEDINGCVLKVKNDEKCTDSISERSDVTEINAEQSSVKTEGASTAVSHVTKDQIPIDYDEPEFVWEDHLEETGAQAALPESFLHVETSIENGFEKDAVVELGLQDGTYWMASIVTPCGQLLGLKYVEKWTEDEEEDDEDEDENKVESVDLWCDALKSDMHPLGWCKANGKTLQPPPDLKQKIPDVEQLLVKVNENASTPPSYLFDMKFGTTPIEFIRKGMLLEVQEEMNPVHVWIARVERNVGGRMLLRYAQAKNDEEDMWMFYLNYRVHPIGWCREQQDGGYKYEPPLFLKSTTENQNINWIELLETLCKEGMESPLPPYIFKEQVKVLNHLFRQGQKLEALHPKFKCAICPATVINVINQHFFIVEIDNVTEDIPDSACLRMCCHKDSPNIFPVRWCVRSGLRLLPPKGWKKQDFDWREYLSKTNSEAAPERAFNLKVPNHDFERGMKLEAVNPDQSSELCASTIIRIVENLMWIHLDTSTKIGHNHVVDVRSYTVFPIGWCESNDYTLKPPKKAGTKKKYNTFNSTFQIEEPMTADEYRSAAYIQMVKGEGSGWCPKIYFNHRCFSGAFLSKCRIAELPKSVGPGPIVLVMKEVLSKLINVAYKSSRVLRELQLEGTPNPNMHQQVLKAKHKGKSYRATVEICKSSEQLEEFCRQVCIKLECCPLIISTLCIVGDCPEDCSQLTKTKYTAPYMKKGKKKLGRPPGGLTNLEMGPKKRGRKRKRGRQPMNRDKRKSDDSEEILNGDNESVSGSIGSSGKLDDEVDRIMFKPNDPDDSPFKKRKYQKKVLPPTDIKTRGIKLPSYSTAMYERRPRSVKIKDLLLPDVDSLNEKKTRKQRASKTSEVWVSPQPIVAEAPTMQSIPIFKGETVLQLKSNPLYWSIEEVVDFIKDTDSAQFARILKEQEIDGQALLMLSLPTVQEYLDYKLGPAVKLCHHVERLKFAFYQQFT